MGDIEEKKIKIGKLKRMRVVFDTTYDASSALYKLTMIEENFTLQEPRKLGYISYTIKNSMASFNSFTVSDINDDNNSLFEYLGAGLMQHFIKSMKKKGCSKITGDLYATDYSYERLKILEDCKFKRDCAGKLTGYNEYTFCLDL